ncbi:MAG TPA: Hsp70 family protein, partial [Dehalococcoidia bacterium]|nr:Hsp70 family protein [Dehalococcoidia bacterium]
IEVSFDIDANGIVNVSAKDKGTGKEQRITITASSGLSKDEIEKLQREAELHAEEDRKRREDVELRNNADNLAYQAEKILRENGDKVPSELKSEVEGKISATREALKGNDTESIRRNFTELSDSLQKIGAAVYGAGGGTPGGEGFGGPNGQSGDGHGPGEGQAEEGTVEGEFREV